MELGASRLLPAVLVGDHAGDAVKAAACERGQVMLLAAVLLLLSCGLFLGLFQAGVMVKEKIRMQTAVDLAVLSALNTEANSLNAIAVANRAILAQDALAARLSALVSESAFYRKLLDSFNWVIRLIPYGGPLLSPALSRGGMLMEQICRRTAQAGIPVLSRADAILSLQSRAVRLSLLPRPLAAARSSLTVNAPRARLSPLSHAALLDQSRRLAGAIGPLGAGKTRAPLEKTLDRHTARRNWRVLAGALPVRKVGGTVIEDGDSRAFDRLQLRIFSNLKWRWKTVVAAGSRASDFNYPRHGELMGISPDTLPRGLTLTLRQDPGEPLPLLLPSDFPLVVVGSGELVYRREGRPEEPPNLMNPFWRARLIPVRDEPGARRQIPPLLLAGTLH
jgi:hypothetical protein